VPTKDLFLQVGPNAKIILSFVISLLLSTPKTLKWTSTDAINAMMGILLKKMGLAVFAQRQFKIAQNAITTETVSNAQLASQPQSKTNVWPLSQTA